MPLVPAPAYEELVERLGVKPLPEPLLDQALTHASYINEADSEAESNERLEFLGDSVLGMVIANELYQHYPDAGEGELTRMRADVVRGSSLAAAAARMGIGEHMILGRGEEAAGGRTRNRNLEGAMEALIGAVYLSQGYRAAGVFVRRLLGPELKAIWAAGGSVLDPKSSLQHMVQARWHEPPDYVTVQEAAGATGRRFTVEVRAAGRTLGHGEGASKREAQQRAAQQAVATLAADAEGQE